MSCLSRHRHHHVLHVLRVLLKVIDVACAPPQGLSEDVSINKFFDEPMLLKLADTEGDDGLAALMM